MFLKISELSPDFFNLVNPILFLPWRPNFFYYFFLENSYLFVVHCSKSDSVFWQRFFHCWMFWINATQQIKCIHKQSFYIFVVDQTYFFLQNNNSAMRFNLFSFLYNYFSKPLFMFLFLYTTHPFYEVITIVYDSK